MIWLWLAAALAAPLAADEAVARAQERSVEVAHADAEVEATRGEVRSTVLFQEDPSVDGHWALQGDARGVAISQPVSLTGEGRAAHRSARASADRAEAYLRRTRLHVAAATRLAWVVAVEARQRVILAEQTLALAIRLREGAEARLDTGDGSLLDARLARLQEAEARSIWMVAVSAEGELMADLAARTGVPVEDLELPADPLEGMPAVVLETRTRSDQEAARYGVEAAEAALRRERAGTLPPVHLGAFYEEEGGELRAGPSVGVVVPLWSRNSDGRARARADLAVARSSATARERTATSEQQATAGVLARLDDGSHDSDPRDDARATLESVALGYERGELDLFTAGLLRQQILEGWRAWLEGRRVLAEARIAAALAHEDERLLR